MHLFQEILHVVCAVLLRCRQVNGAFVLLELLYSPCRHLDLLTEEAEECFTVLGHVLLEAGEERKREKGREEKGESAAGMRHVFHVLHQDLLNFPELFDIALKSCQSISYQPCRSDIRRGWS